MRNSRQFVGLLLLAATTLAACTGPGSAVAQGINQGNRARDFELEALHTSRAALGDYRGNVVLANFWATWCAPCKAEIPALEAAYQEHKDDGFVVLGINVQEPRQDVEEFVANMGVTYPILLDKDGQVMSRYRATGLPMSFIVDRDGIISVRHMGYLSAEVLSQYLDSLLTDRP